MKTGDLLWDIVSNTCVLLVRKKSNVKFVCFFPKNGEFLEIERKDLKQLTPKMSYVKVW